MKPVVGTDRGDVEYIGSCVSDTLPVGHVDGTEAAVKSDNVYLVRPDHDARTLGDQPAVFVEFQGAAGCARPS